MWNLVKIGRAVSEKKTIKDYDIRYIYIVQGQGQITMGDKILIVAKSAKLGSSLEQTCKTWNPQCSVTRFSLEVFLVLEKKMRFSLYMGMTTILFNNVEPFAQIDNTPTTEGQILNLVKIGQAVSEKTSKAYEILYMYIGQGQGQITLGDKSLFVTERVATLIIHCKFQPLVFNTFWETEFAIFSPYIGTQIWP